mgnify:CR=1 FL=1
MTEARREARARGDTALPAQLTWGLIALICLAPLPFGLVHSVHQAGFFTLVGLLAVATAEACRRRGRTPVPLAVLKVEWLLLSIVLVWVGLQMVPLPGLSHPLWQEAATALDAPVLGRITLAPDLTLEAWLRLLGYAVVFWLALQIGRDRHAAKAVLLAVLLGNLAYAIYGLTMHFGQFELILWAESRTPNQHVVATFVSRNNYATFVGLGLLAATGLLISRLVSAAWDLNGRAAWADLAKRLFIDGSALVAVLVVLLTALVLATSRGGFAAALIALFVLIALQLFRASRGVGGRTGAVLVALAPMPFVFGTSGGALVERLLNTDVNEEGRFAAFGAATDAIGDAPLAGFGYGSFQDAFMIYQTRDVEGWYDRLHNDWLEAMFGLGVPMALVLFTVLSLLVVRCLRASFARRRDAVYPMLAVSSSVLIAVHALVDFSLQLPAVTVTWLTLLGLGVAQSWRSGQLAAG